MREEEVEVPAWFDELDGDDLEARIVHDLGDTPTRFLAPTC